MKQQLKLLVSDQPIFQTRSSLNTGSGSEEIMMEEKRSSSAVFNWTILKNVEINTYDV